MNYSKRFSVSFLSNIIKAVASALSSIFIARLLGPEDTGRFFFLLFSFIGIRSLIDFGSSSAFFTFISKRKESPYFVNFYLLWNLLLFIIFLLLIYLMPTYYIDRFWLGEKKELILFAFFGSFMFHQMWPIAYKMAEASKQTLPLHIISIITNITHFLVILCFWFLNIKSLSFIFILTGLEWLIAGFFASRLYIYNTTEPRDHCLFNIFKKYYKFCLPLLPYTLISFFYSIGDKWMLQNWSGAVEQSYLGIGLRFSAIALLCTTSLLAIFWKEITSLYEQGDLEKLEELFNKTILSIYIFTTLIVVITLPWTSSLIDILLGVQYSNGFYTILILFIYPVHQCLGQVTSSFLYAVECTKIQSFIGCIFMLFSLLSCYIILSPNLLFIRGFQLNSVAVAINIVICNILFTNITLYYIYKKFNWRKLFSFQFIIFPLLIFTFSLKFISNYFFEGIYIPIILYLFLVTLTITIIFFKFKKFFISRLFYV